MEVNVLFKGEVFLIFDVVMEDQKVVLFTTWLVLSNFGLDHHKIWLKISEGIKNQID